jgi:hypothetical protein
MVCSNKYINLKAAGAQRGKVNSDMRLNRQAEDRSPYRPHEKV